MARARNLKPAFFQNDLLAEIDPLARLLFAGLWTVADRVGRLEDRPKRIKAAVLPYDECCIETLLKQLADRQFITRYRIAEKAFIEIPNFVKHQNPHCREPESTIPAPDEHSSCTVPELCKTGCSRADSLNPLTDSPSSLTVSSGGTFPQMEAYTAEFEEVWAFYPKRPGANKADSFKAWKARIREGTAPETMIAGTLRYAAYCQRNISAPEFIKQPATFFGKGRHFESDWAVTAASHQSKMTRHQANQAAIAASIFGDAPAQIRVIEGEVAQ